MKFQILFLIGLLMGWPALSDTHTAAIVPMKFKAWKEQQILEAQNKLLRVSARVRAGKDANGPLVIASASPKVDDLAGSARFEKASNATERDVKGARESLEIARELTLQDYAEVYVANLEDDPGQFAKLVDSLSKDELAQLMKILAKIRSEEPSDTPRITPTATAFSTHS